MKLGLVCMLVTTKFKKGFTGINQCRARKDDSRLIEATLHNIQETKKCLDFVINSKIGMYRFSSDLIPFDTEWEWDKDIVIINELLNLGKIIKDNGIRAIIHPSQFCVINSENENVIENSFQILQHHYILSQYLNIEGIIIHTGSSKGDFKQRFIDNAKKLPRCILDKLYLENCHSVNINDVIDICKKVNIKPLVDFHHNRVCGNTDIDVDLIKSMWRNIKPLAHISSGRDFINDKAHNDYITLSDLKLFSKYFGCFDFEVEAKLKDKAILKILEILKSN